MRRACQVPNSCSDPCKVQPKQGQTLLSYGHLHIVSVAAVDIGKGKKRGTTNIYRTRSSLMRRTARTKSFRVGHQARCHMLHQRVEMTCHSPRWTAINEEMKSIDKLPSTPGPRVAASSSLRRCIVPIWRERVQSVLQHLKSLRAIELELLLGPTEPMVAFFLNLDFLLNLPKRTRMLVAFQVFKLGRCRPNLFVEVCFLLQNLGE